MNVITVEMGWETVQESVHDATGAMRINLTGDLVTPAGDRLRATEPSLALEAQEKLKKLGLPGEEKRI